MKLTRLPFTIAMMVLLVGLGIFTQTHIGEIDPEIRSGAGVSTHLLLDGQLHRILTSVFFTAGGWRFYSSLLMFAGAVGYVEWTCDQRPQPGRISDCCHDDWYNLACATWLVSISSARTRPSALRGSVTSDCIPNGRGYQRNAREAKAEVSRVGFPFVALSAVQMMGTCILVGEYRSPA